MNGLIIVLGAPNDANGNLSTIAVERCEQAIREYRRNSGYKILLTARLSAPVITRSGAKRVIVVTSDFHVKRTRYIFERELPGVEIIFSGCSTHLPVDELNALKNHEERALSKLIEESK